MPHEMTTTKIDRDSLNKLRMLAKRESRSAPLELKVLIDSAFRRNPAELSDSEFFDGMMDDLVARSEEGITTDEARGNASRARDTGSISWGSVNGKVVGTLVDGTRVDVEGNILTTTQLDSTGG